MDKSQEYIDMCKEATELQDESRWWILGDCYAENIGEWYTSIFIGYEYCPVASDGRPMINWVWLPRQDQLQVVSPADTSVALIDFFDTFLFEHAYDYDEAQGQFIPKPEWMAMSMEQLWLAFVMSEKFNKEWDGTTWEVNHEND